MSAVTFPSVSRAADAWITYLASQDVQAVTSVGELVGEPAVLIAPPTVAPSGLAGRADVRWTWLLVAGNDGPDALPALSGLLQQVADLDLGWQLAEPTSVPAGEAGTLPAYRITFTQQINSQEDQ